MIAGLKAYAWQALALFLAVLLTWQALARLGAERMRPRPAPSWPTTERRRPRPRCRHPSDTENWRTSTVTTSAPSTPRHGGSWRALQPMLTLPALLLAGCAATSPTTSPPTVPPPRLAPLPDSARQTLAPLICLPSCSAALTNERENWRALLTMPGPGVVPASAPTKLVKR